MKPSWHTGPWTDEDTLDLIDELTEAQQYRSLTNEEQAWLRQAMKTEE
jgi:hypothetical protein